MCACGKWICSSQQCQEGYHHLFRDKLEDESERKQFQYNSELAEDQEDNKNHERESKQSQHNNDISEESEEDPEDDPDVQEIRWF